MSAKELEARATRVSPRPLHKHIKITQAVSSYSARGKTWLQLWRLCCPALGSTVAELVETRVDQALTAQMQAAGTDSPRSYYRFVHSTD